MLLREGTLQEFYTMKLKRVDSIQKN